MNKTDFIGSFAKGLSVIEAFNAEKSRLAIADIAQITGLDRATARRCLLTLHHLGYAEYDGKYFTLTPRVLRLGMGALSALPLSKVVQPWLDQLSDQIGQSCSVAILDEVEIVYVARAAQRRVMSIGLMPGSRLPVHCTSMGRVLLAYLEEEKARDLIQRCNLTPRTYKSLSRSEDIQKRIQVVRERGYETIDQEVELGLRSIAVPLFNAHGHVVAALNVGVAAVHSSPEELVTLYLESLQRIQTSLRPILR
ncbi:MAG: helix-turn-helix domain-containing protein [Methylocystaceae bacterium]|nr:helix-turn-helix domain-containing protein [Methylocystaceae bacterium]